MSNQAVSMATLVFTSANALRRSIRKVYPKLTEEQQEATFNTMKAKVGYWQDSEGEWHPPHKKGGN
jgi:hypothetical protein